MELELLKAVIERPETWGGIAVATSIGWYLAEKRNAKMAEMFRDMMNRSLDHILGKDDA